MTAAQSPRDRVVAIISASFEAGNFRPEVISAWLNFYVLSQSNDGAQRLLRIYHRRLHSNLVYGLRPLVGEDAHDVADTVSAMIDGLYIRHALREGAPSGAAATQRVVQGLDALLEAYS